MTYLLQCYSIEKPVDKYGEAIEPSGQYTTGLLRYVCLRCVCGYH